MDQTTVRERADPEVITKAIREIGFPLKNSVNSVGIKYKISQTTLQRHYAKSIAVGLENYTPHLHLKHRQVFKLEQEELLKTYFLDCRLDSMDLHFKVLVNLPSTLRCTTKFQFPIHG